MSYTLIDGELISNNDISLPLPNLEILQKDTIVHVNNSISGMIPEGTAYRDLSFIGCGRDGDGDTVSSQESLRRIYRDHLGDLTLYSISHPHYYSGLMMISDHKNLLIPMSDWYKKNTYVLEIGTPIIYSARNRLLGALDRSYTAITLPEEYGYWYENTKDTGTDLCTYFHSESDVNYTYYSKDDNIQLSTVVEYDIWIQEYDPIENCLISSCLDVDEVYTIVPHKNKMDALCMNTQIHIPFYIRIYTVPHENAIRYRVKGIIHIRDPMTLEDIQQYLTPTLFSHTYNLLTDVTVHLQS